MTVTPSSEPNPFAPPGGDADAPGPRPPPVAAGYRDQRGVVRLLTALLIAHAALLMTDVVWSLLDRSSLVDPQVLREMLRLLHRIGILPVFMTLAIAVPFAVFLARANRNARRFGEEFLVFSPLSMVWWYFVPVLNLVMPYRAVREVWRASRPTEGQPTGDSPGVLIWWWTTLLTYQLALPASGLAVFVIQGWVSPGAGIALKNNLFLLRSALCVTRDLAALMMVRALHERQRRRATAP